MMRRIWPAPVPLMIQMTSPTITRKEEESYHVAAVSRSVVLVAEVAVPLTVHVMLCSVLEKSVAALNPNFLRSPHGVPIQISCVCEVAQARHMAEEKCPNHGSQTFVDSQYAKIPSLSVCPGPAPPAHWAWIPGAANRYIFRLGSHSAQAMCSAVAVKPSRIFRIGCDTGCGSMFAAPSQRITPRSDSQ